MVEAKGNQPVTCTNGSKARVFEIGDENKFLSALHSLHGEMKTSSAYGGIILSLCVQRRRGCKTQKKYKVEPEKPQLWRIRFTF